MTMTSGVERNIRSPFIDELPSDDESTRMLPRVRVLPIPLSTAMLFTNAVPVDPPSALRPAVALR
jgi:hypothetical protein